MKDYMNEYSRWLACTAEDEKTNSELRSIQNDAKEIEERFYTELEFGTAGLRGIIGAGTNRMNIYVVRRASAGLAKYLLNFKSAKTKGVAVAYDSRHYSKEFAEETACTLAAYGIKCYLYSTLHSVPQLSFTIREKNCMAGVVITASHNPPEYNGYKVYWHHGGQVAPKQADEILSCIRASDYFNTEMVSLSDAVNSGLVEMIGEDVDEVYYKKTMSLMLRPELVKEHGGDIAVVYTPLHGSGFVPVTNVLHRIGIKRLYTVPEQEQPNGSFPTVKAPNPEDPDAFTLASKLADEVGADLILATDPDSDRLGIDVRMDNGSFRTLTGNQIGCILIKYLLSTMKELGTLPSNGLVVKSLVSTSLADAICRSYGVTMRHVLTGFRFIAEQIDLAEATGEFKFIFGFEESYGFLAGGYSHDKDAICAAMLAAEAAVYYSTKGKTLYDVLNDIYAEYGFYIETTKSYTLSGKAGMEAIADTMEQLRKHPLTAVADEAVLSYEDILEGTKLYISSGETEKLNFPSSNVLRYNLFGDAWVIVRPSGTEPKLKLYVGAKADTKEKAAERVKKLTSASDEVLSRYLYK